MGATVLTGDRVPHDQAPLGTASAPSGMGDVSIKQFNLGATARVNVTIILLSVTN